MSVPEQRVRSAAIRRQQRQAQRELIAMLGVVDRDLIGIFSRALDQINRELIAAADGSGLLRLEQLAFLREQLARRLVEMRASLDARLDVGLEDGARLGSQPLVGFLESSVLATADERALQFVRAFVGPEDKLQLSDRIWRVNQHTRRIVIEAVQSAIIQGHSAIRAAEEFLERGEAVPAELVRKRDVAQAAPISRSISSQVLRDEGSPLRNAKRLFRTEIARARIESFRSAAFEHPDVVGTRFLLSPRHPRQDICDMHARVNRYGLGPGVYPRGRSPLPAHPETLSFEEVVFADEVTAEDRAGKEDRISWLKRQPGDLQVAVVGGIQKREALVSGLLTERQIKTPWRILKRRYERQGVI